MLAWRLGMNAGLRRMLALLVIAGAACAGDGSNDDTQPSSLSILDGAEDHLTTAVVFVMPAICTGTVIAPNLVLTAQHCVAPLDDAPDAELEGCYPSVFEAPIAAAAVSVYTGNPTGDATEDRHRVLEIVLPPYTSPANQICGNDVALLILESPISSTVVTPIVPRVDVPLAAGEGYSAVGFGKIDPDIEVDTDNAVRYRRDGLVVECVGTGCTPQPGYVVASEWRGDGATCSGDSGGPAIDAAGRVVGVDSRNNGCGTYALYGGVEPRGAWIRETAIHAAQIGGYDAPPWSTGWPTDPAYSWPIGDPCTAPSDCSSGLCVDEICTRSCNDAAPCPEGFLCSGSEVCEPEDAPAAEDPERTDEPASDGCTVAGSSSQAAGWAALFGALMFVVRRRAAQSRSSRSATT